MNQIMSPPKKPISKGQAGKFADKLVAALVKSGLPGDPTQKVLEEDDSLVGIFVALIRERIEAKSNLFVRWAKVNRTASPQELIATTGRKDYSNRSVLAGMPQGEGDEVPVTFFKLVASAYDKNGWISDDALAAEYKLRKLKPDPRAQVAVNQDDEAFADKFPNGSHWKDTNGNWCCVLFNAWDDERYVRVYQGRGRWYGSYWFAGVPA